MKGTAIYPSPVGDIQLDWEDGAVTALKNADRAAKADVSNELTRLVFRQLDEYFAGTRKAFDFPYRLHGTPFQERVWAALREIPYGETRSYKDIAEAIESIPGSWHGKSCKSHFYRYPMPSRHWCKRIACRLWRRVGKEKSSFRVGAIQQGMS